MIVSLLRAAIPTFAKPGVVTPDFDVTAYHHVPTVTFASAVHVAVVDVDRDTGSVKLVRYVVAHDCGKVINPFIAMADMEGSFMQSFQVATNAIPYDKEFPGQMHSNIAFLSFPIPTIMEFPDELEQVFIESLEPRWFYGYKGFSETSIGSVPGAIGNAIYNAIGVRVSHPISAERILMALKKRREVV